MKRRPLVHRTPANLSDSIHQRLNMYALSAGAAGVGILALSQPAGARIIYTPAHRVIAPHHSYTIDFNHDKITDFRIANHVSACTDYCFYELRLNPADGNRAAGYLLGSGFPLDSALNRGARIGPRSPLKKGFAALVVARANHYTSNATSVFGPWANVKNRYLGLAFQIKGQTHYGWARLNVTVSKTTITATLTGYAYETVPNKPIIAGKQDNTNAGESLTQPLDSLGTPASATGTLGMLALGTARTTVVATAGGR